jgi:hypothetical protein
VRRKSLGIAAGLTGLALLGGLVGWRLTRPSNLGLERPRLVLLAGEVTLDGARARAAQPFDVGATLRTGHGSACFSVRAARVCMGANAEAVLAQLDGTSATVHAERGAFVAFSADDDLRVALPLGAGAVVVQGATMALEDLGSADATVRALDGSVTVQAAGQPDLRITAPEAVGQRDGKKRPRAATLEAEERAVVQLARSWQGTAGAIIDVDGLHGRVEVDGAQVGLAPASVLVEEGTHTLVIRDGARETTHEALKLSAGQRVVRGG